MLLLASVSSHSDSIHHDHLGLHEAAHDAEAVGQRSSSRTIGAHARDNCVVWSLARCKAVRMVRLQAKVVPAVMQSKATRLRNNACSKAHVIAA